MLSHVENISIHFVPHFLSKKGHIRVIKAKYRHDFIKRITKEEYNDLLEEQIVTPLRLILDNKTYWMFKSRFYKDTENLDEDSVRALLLSRQQLRQDRINRAKTITAAPEIDTKIKRNVIPDDVKMIVWQRDKGRCVKCEAQIELQFDHIIPITMGGASTPENLQILCGKCNRSKGKSVI